MSFGNGSGSCLALSGFLLWGCGSTSGLRYTEGRGPEDLRGYERVVVVDFDDETLSLEDVGEIDIACRNFPDRIAIELRETEAFDDVVRTTSKTMAIPATTASTLVISGAILRYVEGSAAERFWIGFGAGSSYFDAMVVCHDGATGDEIARIEVDKNSWALGGGLASGQTVEAFMNGAASKIATELEEVKGERTAEP